MSEAPKEGSKGWRLGGEFEAGIEEDLLSSSVPEFVASAASNKFEGAAISSEVGVSGDSGFGNACFAVGNAVGDPCFAVGVAVARFVGFGVAGLGGLPVSAELEDIASKHTLLDWPPYEARQHSSPESYDGRPLGAVPSLTHLPSAHCRL